MIKKLRDKYRSFSLPIKAAFWYTICNFINKGISLLSTPIFTRILTEEQYGTYAIFQSWINILIIFTSLNIFLSSYTKGLLKYKNDTDNFTTSQLGLMITLTCFIGTIIILNIDFFGELFNLSPIILVGMIIELLTMPILEIWLARERFDYKYKMIIIITLSMNVVSLIISIISILNTNYKIEARVFSDGFTKLIFTLPLFILILSKSKKIYKKEYWKYALGFNIPLIPHYLSNYILTQSDRIMIGSLVGNTEAAYYSVAYTISTVVVLLVTATNNALTPYIYKSIENKQYKNIKKNMSTIVILMAILVVIIMIFAPEIIRIFAGNNYLDAMYVIPPVSASVFFIYTYSLFSNIEYYYQKTFLIAIATTLSAILNVLLNYFAINKFGYYAAGYTTLICYISLTIFHYIAYKKVLREKIPTVKSIYDLRTISICSTFVLFAMTIIAITYKFLMIRYIFLIVLILICILKKNYFISIFNTFKDQKEE